MVYSKAASCVGGSFSSLPPTCCVRVKTVGNIGWHPNASLSMLKCLSTHNMRKWRFLGVSSSRHSLCYHGEFPQVLQFQYLGGTAVCCSQEVSSGTYSWFTCKELSLWQSGVFEAVKCQAMCRMLFSDATAIHLWTTGSALWSRQHKHWHYLI